MKDDIYKQFVESAKQMGEITRGELEPSRVTSLSPAFGAPYGDQGMRELSDKVVGVISEFLGLEKSKIGLDSRIAEDLGADSLDYVEIVMALEEEFKLHVPDERAEEIEPQVTVRDLVNLIIELQSSGKEM